MNRKRASIVDELIASEKDYVADLTLAVDMYLKVSHSSSASCARTPSGSLPTLTPATSQPLRDSLSTNEPILPSEMTLRSLFSDIEVIRNYNSALLQQILRRHAQWGPYQKIGAPVVLVACSLARARSLSLSLPPPSLSHNGN